MENNKDNFIFRRSHRRLTYTSILAILPLLVTGLAAGLVWLTNTALARQVLEFIISLPTWGLAIIWLVFPILTIVLAQKGEKHGTLYQLRSWNAFTYKLALLLLVSEVIVIIIQIL